MSARGVWPALTSHGMTLQAKVLKRLRRNMS
jgi:hypothetical protein